MKQSVPPRLAPYQFASRSSSNLTYGLHLFFGTYGSFSGVFFTLGLVHKGERKIFSTNVYVRIKKNSPLTKDKILSQGRMVGKLSKPRTHRP